RDRIIDTSDYDEKAAERDNNSACHFLRYSGPRNRFLRLENSAYTLFQEWSRKSEGSGVLICRSRYARKCRCRVRGFAPACDFRNSQAHPKAWGWQAS